jgi:hypothetical protein
MAWFEGVSKFFQWLYIGLTSIWNSFSLIIMVGLLIGIQVGFIIIYFKVGNFVLSLYPRFIKLKNRIERFLD